MLRAVLALGLTVCAQCAVPDIYAVGVGFGPKNKRTVSRGYKVDPASGEWAQVSTNMVYAGSSAKWDGLSAFDEARGVFYWFTGFETNLVYSINVTSGALLAPIDLFSNGIITLTMDPYHSELVVVDVPTNLPNTTRMTRYSEADITQTTLPVSVTPSHGAVEPTGSHRYVNYNPMTGELEYLNALTAVVEKKVKLASGCTSVSLLFFDSQGDLWAGEFINMQDRISKIDQTTGACSTPVLLTPNEVLAYSANLAHGELWFGSVNKTATYLHSYDPVTGASTIIQNKMSALTPITDIAVKY